MWRARAIQFYSPPIDQSDCSNPHCCVLSLSIRALALAGENSRMNCEWKSQCIIMHREVRSLLYVYGECRYKCISGTTCDAHYESPSQDS